MDNEYNAWSDPELYASEIWSRGAQLDLYSHILKAQRKHPRFCDCLTAADLRGAKHDLKIVRDYNEFLGGEAVAMSVLQEELHEIEVAYLSGDKVHAIEEILDAMAVLARMFACINREIERGAE